jgi:hypothetical protein
VYDNTGLAVWYFSSGLVALAAARVLGKRTPLSVFLLGIACGFAVWCRLNFLWLLAGLSVATILVHRDFVRLLLRRGGALLAGFCLGALPLLIYEWRSGLGTLEFMRTQGGERPAEALARRSLDLAQSFFYDSFRLGIWDGQMSPAWSIGAAVVVLCAVVFLLAGRSGGSVQRWGKGASAALLAAVVLTLLSSLHVTVYHFVGYLPCAAIAVASAGILLAHRSRIARVVVICASIAYVVASGFWLARTAEGLERTGGTGPWSNAISNVAQEIRKHGIKDVSILDWGLGNNLYVLTEGRIQYREIFWDPAYVDARLRAELASANVFLMNAEGNRHFPHAAAGFANALESSGRPSRELTFAQKDGSPYARLVLAGGNSLPRGIRALHPSATRPGQGFNVQPDGSSAIAVEGIRLRSGDVVVWDRQSLETVVVPDGTLATALVPPALYGRPGMIRITIRARDGSETGPLEFRVSPPADQGSEVPARP